MEKKVVDLTESFKQEKQSREMQIKTAHHRNRALLLENERPTKELDELKKQLDKEEKENDYALIKTHNYREELVDACQAKEKEES